MEDECAVVGSTEVPKSWTFQRDKGKERNVKEKEREQKGKGTGLVGWIRRQRVGRNLSGWTRKQFCGSGFWPNLDLDLGLYYQL